MVKNKKIVCFCHDVTEEDIIKAIKEGNECIEEIKRYTGAMTGFCQGKSCSLNVIEIFCRETGRPLEEVLPPTYRPPIKPIKLGLLQ